MRTAREVAPTSLTSLRPLLSDRVSLLSELALVLLEMATGFSGLSMAKTTTQKAVEGLSMMAVMLFPLALVLGLGIVAPSMGE